MAGAKKLSPADTRAVALINEQIAHLHQLFKRAEAACRITDCATLLLMRRQLVMLRKEIANV